MFSMIFWFSFSVFFIRLRGFSPGSHFSLTIPRSTELASKKKDNCNNVILEAESFQSRSHMTTIIQNFTLVSLTSTITPHRVWLLFGASSSLFDLRTRFLLTLCTWSLTVYATELTKHLYTSRKNIPLWYLQIVHLLRYEIGSSSGVI